MTPEIPVPRQIFAAPPEACLRPLADAMARLVDAHEHPAVDGNTLKGLVEPLENMGNAVANVLDAAGQALWAPSQDCDEWDGEEALASYHKGRTLVGLTEFVHAHLNRPTPPSIERDAASANGKQTPQPATVEEFADRIEAVRHVVAGIADWLRGVRNSAPAHEKVVSLADALRNTLFAFARCIEDAGKTLQVPGLDMSHALVRRCRGDALYNLGTYVFAQLKWAEEVICGATEYAANAAICAASVAEDVVAARPWWQHRRP